MALVTGNQGQWGVGANGGYVWGGQGVAPMMTEQQKLQSMGFMSDLPANGFNPGMLGGQMASTQMAPPNQGAGNQYGDYSKYEILPSGAKLYTGGGYKDPGYAQRQAQMAQTGGNTHSNIPRTANGNLIRPPLQHSGQTYAADGLTVIDAPGRPGQVTAGGPGQMPSPAPGPAGLNTSTTAPNWQALQQLTQAGLSPQQIQNLAANRSGQMVPVGDSGFQSYNPTMTPGAPKYGLAGAEEGLQRGLAGGIAGIEAGINQAASTLSPYTQGGGKAFELQQALSGALGPDAQRQAFANYNQSPEMAYALEQAEKGITRNAAATGKLGSGNVLQELQRNAIGMAQQDYGNAFARLGSLSAMGQNSANLLGGLQANAGGKVGDYGFGTGQALADYRTRAGEQIAGNVANTGSQLSGMINQQGNDLSSLIGASGNQLSQLLAGYGSADAQTKQALAALLANIASGSASQVQGVPGLPGANDSGILGSLGNILSGVGNAAIGYKAVTG